MPPRYLIKEIDETWDGLVEQLVLVDLGPWDRHQTVTNNPEHVINDLAAHGWLKDKPRVLYYDSDGCMDAEMLYDKSLKFTQFKYLPTDQHKQLDKLD